jgi:hypothetical protein
MFLGPWMLNTVVTYTVRPEAYAEHVRLIERVFEQLHSESPGNVDYQLHYRRAIFNASQSFMQQGRALAEQRDYVGAYNAFRQAFGYDPVNQLAVSEMERMLRLEQVKQGITRTDSGDGNPRTDGRQRRIAINAWSGASGGTGSSTQARTDARDQFQWRGSQTSTQAVSARPESERHVRPAIVCPTASG